MDDNAVMEERRARRSFPGEAQIVAHARGGEALAGCLLRTMQRPHRAGERDRHAGIVRQRIQCRRVDQAGPARLEHIRRVEEFERDDLASVADDHADGIRWTGHGPYIGGEMVVAIGVEVAQCLRARMDRRRSLPRGDILPDRALIRGVARSRSQRSVVPPA